MSAYSTVIQVRFGHVDPAGIAYFPRIFDYVHDVFEEVWEMHVGTRYYHLLLGGARGLPPRALRGRLQEALAVR